jgi:uncharacterized membrane protein
MVKSRFVYLFICLTLVLSLAGGFMAVAASAQSPTPTPSAAPSPAPSTTPTTAPSATPTATPSPTSTTPILSLETDIPSYSDDSGAIFNFDVTIKYNGNDRQTANISASTSAPGWIANVTYAGRQANAIDIGPAGQYGPDTKTVQVSLSPGPSQKPDKGSYVVTLKVTAGNLTKTIDLTGIIKSKTSYSMNSDTGRLSMSAEAGKENHYTVVLNNAGTEPLSNISFSSDKPDNWIIKFNPEKVDTLAAGKTQQVDVIITPPSGKTIAGDYMISLRSNNDKVSSNMEVRVTALTPSIWGWVSIIIIVVVVAGLAALFLKLGRR